MFSLCVCIPKFLIYSICLLHDKFAAPFLRPSCFRVSAACAFLSALAPQCGCYAHHSPSEAAICLGDMYCDVCREVSRYKNVYSREQKKKK
ncbi:hypothetical protein F4803DRAFT_511450, partial [Xylaria telfairii]